MHGTTCLPHPPRRPRPPGCIMRCWATLRLFCGWFLCQRSVYKARTCSIAATVSPPLPPRVRLPQSVYTSTRVSANDRLFRAVGKQAHSLSPLPSTSHPLSTSNICSFSPSFILLLRGHGRRIPNTALARSFSSFLHLGVLSLSRFLSLSVCLCLASWCLMTAVMDHAQHMPGSETLFCGCPNVWLWPVTQESCWPGKQT